jgi:hypothetical protein
MSLFLVFFHLQLSIYVVLYMIYNYCVALFIMKYSHYHYFVCGYFRVSWFQIFNGLLIKRCMQNSFRFSQWNHLFYFLLQGIILILKRSRYFIYSESIKKMSIFKWYLALVSFFQEINADSHKNSYRLHSRNWIFYL